MDRRKESAAATLRGRIRRSRSDGLSLRDESRGILGEAVTTSVYIQDRSRDKVSAHERYLGTKPNLRHLRVSDGEVSDAEMPPDVQEIGTRPESPIPVPLTGPSAELGRFDQSDEEPASTEDSAVQSPAQAIEETAYARRRGSGRYRIPIPRGRSHAGKRPTQRHKVPGLRQRSPHRVPEGYADLPAQEDPSNGPGITSTWRIIRRA
jgi:hypothetical protein